MKKIILILAVFLPLISFALSEKKDFEYFKKIEKISNAGVYQIDIDSEVESKSKKFLSDLRIFSDEGEVKYITKKEKDEYIKEKKDVNLNIIYKKGKEVLVDLGNNKKEEYINEIFFDTDSKDFRKVINVKGADIKNGPYFNLNIEGKRGDLVYDSPEGRDFSIKFKYSNYKYLKLRFDGENENINIKSFYRIKKNTKIIPGEKEFLKVKGFNGVLKGNDQSIILDIKKDNLFFDQLKLNFLDKRFSRDYVLYSSNDKNAEILNSSKRFDSKKEYWVEVSRGKLNKEVYTGNPIIKLKNNRRFYRLDIFNGDNKALIFEDAIFEKFKKKIFFKLNGREKEIKLYYSSPRVVAPKYDFYLSKGDLKNAKKLKLDREEKNNYFVAKEKSIFDDNSWLIYLMIFMVISVLIFFVYKIIKESNSKTDRDGMQI